MEKVLVEGKTKTADLGHKNCGGQGLIIFSWTKV